MRETSRQETTADPDASRFGSGRASALVTDIVSASDASFRVLDSVGTQRTPVESPRQEFDGIGPELREFLLAHAVGFDFAGPLPPPAPSAGTDVDALVNEARSAGHLLADGRITDDLAQHLLATTPAHRVRSLQRLLVDGLVGGGHPLDGVARKLARSGLRDPRVASALERAGDEALAARPALAAALYDEACSAGADALRLAARRAQAAAAAGDLDRAAQILDELFAREDRSDLDRAADVAVSIWSRRGMLERGAAVYRALAARTAVSPLTAVVLIGIGDRTGAQATRVAGTEADSPSLCATASLLMRDGIVRSLDEPLHALPTLIRASDALTASGMTTAPLPDTPAALAALVALHGGEPDVCLSVLEAAIEGGQGGAAALARLHLLRGWALMLLDRPAAAQEAITHSRRSGCPLTPRDAVLLHALEAGLARRSDDGPALVRAWKQARESLLHVSVDLYTLLPLGELLVTSSRLRDSQRIAPHLAEAWALLARLGEPALWSVPLHWCAVQAAILRERPEEVSPHATALVRAAAGSRMAAVFSTAGRCWMSVLAGAVDVTLVEMAAHELASVGLSWDGARLAGHAAARTEDRRDMARLLSCARDLHSPLAVVAPVSRPATTPLPGPAPTSHAPADSAALSPREREVARLVLDGKTYREIGEAIFISPRTAEHHIARIRRRVGATTRSDLITRLRIALEDDEAGPD